MDLISVHKVVGPSVYVSYTQSRHRKTTKRSDVTCCRPASPVHSYLLNYSTLALFYQPIHKFICLTPDKGVVEFTFIPTRMPSLATRYTYQGIFYIFPPSLQVMRKQNLVRDHGFILPST
jgi:hypothetical protein